MLIGDPLAPSATISKMAMVARQDSGPTHALAHRQVFDRVFFLVEGACCLGFTLATWRKRFRELLERGVQLLDACGRWSRYAQELIDSMFHAIDCSTSDVEELHANQQRLLVDRSGGQSEKTDILREMREPTVRRALRAWVFAQHRPAWREWSARLAQASARASARSEPATAKNCFMLA